MQPPLEVGAHRQQPVPLNKVEDGRSPELQVQTKRSLALAIRQVQLRQRLPQRRGVASGRLYLPPHRRYHRRHRVYLGNCPRLDRGEKTRVVFFVVEKRVQHELVRFGGETRVFGRDVRREVGQRPCHGRMRSEPRDPTLPLERVGAQQPWAQRRATRRVARVEARLKVRVRDHVADGASPMTGDVSVTLAVFVFVRVVKGEDVRGVGCHRTGRHRRVARLQRSLVVAPLLHQPSKPVRDGSGFTDQDVPRRHEIVRDPITAVGERRVISVLVVGHARREVVVPSLKRLVPFHGERVAREVLVFPRQHAHLRPRARGGRSVFIVAFNRLLLNEREGHEPVRTERRDPADEVIRLKHGDDLDEPRHRRLCRDFLIRFLGD